MISLHRDWRRLLERWRGSRLLLALALALVLALGAGWWLAGTRSPSLPQPSLPPSSAPVVSTESAEARPTQYVCPMMHIPPTDQPGRCPVCGMELVPVDHGGDSSAPWRLALSPGESELAEIRVAPVARRPAVAEVRLFGRIDYDPSHSTVISAFMPGVIDRIYIRRAGQFVRWGDPLFDLYSSDLLETQQQLAKALKYVPGFLAFQGTTPHVAQDMPIQARPSGDKSRQTPEVEQALQTISALRHKLSILGLPKRDIDEFMKVGEATGVATIYAPMYGQVTVQNAYEGTFVNRGAQVMTIADPKYVWLRMDAYEMDYAWIRKGQRVDFTTEAYPGETFHARVVFIDPVFDAESRSFRVGAISTEDQGGRLKAGMLARAVIEARLDAEGRVAGEASGDHPHPLVIPDTAPLITGRRAVVYVAEAQRPGVYEGREVTLGPRTRDGYIVRQGLSEGELVVVNGSFKIDSALQIQAGPSLMHPVREGTGTGESGMPAAPWPPAPEAIPASLDPDLPEAAPQNMPPDSPAGERVPAVEHHRPGDSHRMHEDYMHERRESRTIMERPAKTIGPELDPGPPEDEGVRSLRRRRPGQYGDPTRPDTGPARR